MFLGSFLAIVALCGAYCFTTIGIMGVMMAVSATAVEAKGHGHGGGHGGAHAAARGGPVARGAYHVGGRYYGGIWYGHVRRWWGGRWWPYGVGSCWVPSPIGFVWVCG
jgi:hypothetical protein